jgi:hypothetical protein
MYSFVYLYKKKLAKSFRKRGKREEGGGEKKSNEESSKKIK